MFNIFVRCCYFILTKYVVRNPVNFSKFFTDYDVEMSLSFIFLGFLDLNRDFSSFLRLRMLIIINSFPCISRFFSCYFSLYIAIFTYFPPFGVLTYYCEKNIQKIDDLLFL